MSKNSYLTFFIFLTALFLFNIKPIKAESEMDLLLFEKKNENTTTTKEASKNVDTDKTLSSNLSKANDNEKEKKQDDKTDNWLKSWISTGVSEIFKSVDEKSAKDEEDRINKILLNRRANAANFDISGIKLRMSPKETEEVLKSNGYRKIMETLEIPNFIKWRSEELCRLHGVIGFERLNACATRVAKENGYQFIEKQVYNKYLTKESIEVLYTSTFTNNLAHRIFYKSRIPYNDSNESKNVYLNNIKVYEFWRKVDMKYGRPDNESEVKWGLGGKKPFLKATTGSLELADPLLKQLDSSRMVNEDARFANTQYYTF